MRFLLRTTLALLILAPTTFAETLPYLPPTIPPAGVPVVKPLHAIFSPGPFADFGDNIAPLPTGHNALISTRIYILDAGKMAADTWRWWLGGLMALVAIVVLWGAWRAWRKQARHNLIPGVEHCRRCNYCLQGVASPTCPECGYALTKSNRFVPRPVRKLVRRPLAFLCVLSLAFLSLHLTSPHWQPMLRQKLSWHSPALTLTANRLGLTHYIQRWSDLGAAVVEYDLATGQPTRFIAWRPNGYVAAHFVVSADYSKALCWFVEVGDYHIQTDSDLVDLATGRQLPSPVGTVNNYSGFSAYDYTFDDHALFFAKTDGSIDRIDLHTGRLIVFAPPRKYPQNDIWCAGIAQMSSDRVVTAMAFDGGFGSWDVETTIRKSQTGEVIRQDRHSFNSIPRVDLTSDRLYVIDPPGANQSTLQVWDLNSNRLLASWPAPRAGWTESVKPLTHDLLLVDDQIRESLTGRLIAVIAAPLRSGTADACITADGSHLAVLDYDSQGDIEDMSTYDLNSLPLPTRP